MKDGKFFKVKLKIISALLRVAVCRVCLEVATAGAWKVTSLNPHQDSDLPFVPHSRQKGEVDIDWHIA